MKDLKPSGKQLLQENAGKRRLIEKEIEGLFASLRSASVYLRQHQQALVAQSKSVGRQLAQAESDLNALGNSSAAYLVLLLVTFLTPFWDGGFQPINVAECERNVLQARQVTAILMIRRRQPRQVRAAQEKSSAPTNLSAYDREVPKDFNHRRRNRSAVRFSSVQNTPNNLSEQANLDVSFEDEDGEKSNNYAAAAYKLRLAVRLKNDDTSLLNQLGYALYKQGKIRRIA